MGWEAGQCRTSTPEGIFIVTPSLEGWSSKAREEPSPHEVRHGPTGHQPSISMSLGIKCHIRTFYVCVTYVYSNENYSNSALLHL